MSADRNFWHWCRVPPDPPRYKYKKLVAASLVCAILSVSIFVGSPAFYGAFMAGSVGTLAASATVLSVANIGQGPCYIQNATYQQIAEADNSTVQNYEQTMELVDSNMSDGFYLGYNCCFASNETHASINMTVANLRDEDLTATSIEVYRGNNLFAQIDGPFQIKANSVGAVYLQIYNISALSDDEAQLIRQFRQTGESNTTVFAGRVMYPVLLKTSEGISASYEKFMFPTPYVWPYCG